MHGRRYFERPWIGAFVPVREDAEESIPGKDD